ncbi:MAG: 1-phosphofructokinase family hexose kinase [Thermoleophilia bacterium]|nr:1-phosphofructokinase family hexose kinase [Thermoleophilia bacterium]
MIVTITMNAALDRTVSVPNFQPGTRNRAISAVELPGGKGVNVARSLKRLGIPVIATGLAGGSTGTAIIEGLTGEGILNDFVRIRAESRTSTAIIDPNGRQTEVIEYGPEITEDELGLFVEKLRFLARGADMMVLAGSLPRGVDIGFYGVLQRELADAVFIAVDAQGPALRAALAAGPHLVSPNAREAEEIVGYEFSDVDDIAVAAQTLTDLGAAAAIIHHPDGCVARERHPDGKGGTAWSAVLEHRDVLTSVGSGDALLGGYVAAVSRGESMEGRLRLAVACGAANTLMPGAGVFDLADVEALARQVEISHIGTPEG